MVKKATVRDLRYHFRDIEARLRKGEEIEVHKRKKMIARLMPVSPNPEAYPDFAVLRRPHLRWKADPHDSYGRCV